MSASESRFIGAKPGNWSSETPKSTVTISAIGEEESFCSFACHTRANEGTNIRPVGVWLPVIRLFRYIQIDMGQVMELWLSCYLVCYQLIAKPGNKTAAVSWPGPYSIDIHIATNTFFLVWIKALSAKIVNMALIKWDFFPLMKLLEFGCCVLSQWRKWLSYTSGLSTIVKCWTCVGLCLL